jgi:heptaprenyl diphosphate synthase
MRLEATRGYPTATDLADYLVRRGLPSTRHQFSDSVAVLAGDFLFARAFQLFASVSDPRVVTEAADVVGVMCSGEISQHLDHGRMSSESEYFGRIEAKTAHFLESSCRLGGMAAGVDADTEAALARFGHEIGMAYQVIDDLLDWSTDEARLGKPVGEDIRQGVFTLPVIYAESQPDYADELNQNLDNLNNGGIDRVRELLERCGAIEYARGVAEGYVESARKVLFALPSGPARKSLEDLAVFIGRRDH